MLRKLRLGFYISLAVLIINALVPLLLSNRIAILRADADEASAIREAFEELLSAYKDAETGQRGYMLTGRSSFLEPYETGRVAIEALLPKLQQQLRNDPAQIERFAELLELDKQEKAFQQMRIAQRGNGIWYDVEASEHGRFLMDRLRSVIGDIGAAERAYSDARLRRVQSLQRWSNFSLIAITALDLILFVFIFILMGRSIRAERAARSALTVLNRNLADEVTLRTEALSRLQQQSARLNQVIQIQTSLAEAQLNIDIFTKNLVQRMMAIAPTTGVVIEMIEENDMVYIAASGSIAQFVGLRIPQRGSLSGLCIEKNEVMISADTSDDPRVDKEACAKVGAATMIVTPLLRAGEPVGVLKIVADRPNAFDDNAVQTLQLMGGALGAALGNQMQFQKNQTLLSERSITLNTLKRELQRREEYEKKLLAQRARTQAILESSHEAFISIDAQGRVSEWNALAASTFGWTKEDVIGKSLGEMILPERLREAHRKGLAHFLETGEGPLLNRRVELQALHRDGHEIPIELTISVLREGDSIEFPCFLRDISERKHAETLLMNQRETLYAMTNAIPALVSLIDMQEHFVYCNDEYETIYAKPLDQIIGRSLRECIGEENYPHSKPFIDKALAGEPVVYERTVPTAIGARHQECRHIPQFDADGKPNGFYLIAWDITERKEQEIAWQSRASRDELTGLSNRASFTESLNLALIRHARTDANIAVLYLDVDRFKNINDTYGHAAGDTLLKAFAQYLRQSVRQSDIVGRLGGDEFCILLEDVKAPANAIAVAEKILGMVRTPVPFENHTLSISTSIGIAFAPQPRLTSTQLIALADAALYKAKQAGRNRYVLDIISAD